MTAPASGRLVSVAVKIGSMVEKGQTLAEDLLRASSATRSRRPRRTWFALLTKMETHDPF